MYRSPYPDRGGVDAMMTKIQCEADALLARLSEGEGQQ